MQETKIKGYEFEQQIILKQHSYYLKFFMKYNHIIHLHVKLWIQISIWTINNRLLFSMLRKANNPIFVLLCHEKEKTINKYFCLWCCSCVYESIQWNIKCKPQMDCDQFLSITNKLENLSFHVLYPAYARPFPPKYTSVDSQ